MLRVRDYELVTLQNLHGNYMILLRYKKNESRHRVLTSHKQNNLQRKVE
jgi:hypothetical protein